MDPNDESRSHACHTRGPEERYAIVDEATSHEAAASWGQDAKVRRTTAQRTAQIGSADGTEPARQLPRDRRDHSWVGRGHDARGCGHVNRRVLEYFGRTVEELARHLWIAAIRANVAVSGDCCIPTTGQNAPFLATI